MVVAEAPAGLPPVLVSETTWPVRLLLNVTVKTFVVVEVKASSADDLRAYADRFYEQYQGPRLVATTSSEIGSYVVKASDELDATRVKDEFGPGGGRPRLVQGKLTKGRPSAGRLQELLT